MLAYGSPEKKEDIMEYLKEVYGGRDPPEFAIKETLNKYSIYNFRSPSSDILRTLKRQMAEALNPVEVHMAFKHWKPSIDQIVREIDEKKYDRVFLLPLFPIKNTSVQNSYIDPFTLSFNATKKGSKILSINGMTDSASLTEHWVHNIRKNVRTGDLLLFTAHSLPHTVEQEYEYDNIFKAWSSKIANMSGITNYKVGYQSKGSYGKNWLEPSVYEVLEEVKDKNFKRIVTAPIGFLYDHLEVLYDLDFLVGNKVKEMGMEYDRISLPNNSKYMIDTILEYTEMMKNE
jgi:ferrochelatase